MERNLSLIIIFTISILGPCSVFAASAMASIYALGRNPSAAPKIFTAMVTALVFAEVLSLTAILVVFQIFTK